MSPLWQQWIYCFLLFY